MMNKGFSKTTSDHCVFVKNFSDGKFIILLLYVDDMLIVGQDSTMINKLKLELSKYFAMKDLGAAKQILGMKIVRDRNNGLIGCLKKATLRKFLRGSTWIKQSRLVVHLWVTSSLVRINVL